MKYASETWIEFF